MADDFPVNRIAVLALTEGGCTLGARLAQALAADFYASKGQLAETMRRVWNQYEGIICIMAAGIVVRTIAPLLQDKYHDPAVVVCDEQGQFAISLVSGHLGGANELAHDVARQTGGQAVITTASDVLGQTALDLWCRDVRLVAADRKQLTRCMGKLVDRGRVALWSRFPLPMLPEDIQQIGDPAKADLIIDTLAHPESASAALLYPKALVVGIGCNRGTPADEIAEAVYTTCETHHQSPHCIARLATINLKRDEAGLLEFATRQHLEIVFYSADQLNQVENVAFSAAAFKATGAQGVAEPAALLAAGKNSRLVIHKTRWPNVTVAIAEIANPLQADIHINHTRTPHE